MKRIIVSLVCLLGIAVSSFAQNANKDVNVDKHKTRYTSIVDLIKGIPGVTVQGGGNGVMPEVIVRGIGTNSSNTQPLFVVDDVITSDFTYLNPDDVDHVEVLKDGMAAIYGVQGANGVILFYTKTFMEQQERAAEQARLARSQAKQAKIAAKEAKKQAKAGKK